jgi:hypothetical protein
MAVLDSSYNGSVVTRAAGAWQARSVHHVPKLAYL